MQVSKDQQFLTEISDAELQDDLQDVAAGWRSLATQLRIAPMKQNEIQGEDSRVLNCLEAVIAEWLWGVKTEHTKKEVVKALRSNSLQENALAKEIEDSDEKGT